MALADWLDRVGTGIANAPPDAWFALSQGLTSPGNFAQGLARGVSGFGQQYEADKKQKGLAAALSGMTQDFTQPQRDFITAASQYDPGATMGMIGQQIFKPQQQGPFLGESVPAQAMNVVVRGQRDPAIRNTPEYAAAWQQLYGKPQLVPGPTGELVPVMTAPPQGFVPPGATAAPQGGGTRAPTVGAPLPGTGTAPTSEQALSQGFATRLEQADKILSDPKITESVKDPMNRIGEAVLGNYGVSSSYQQGTQAQRNFINAQLRRESGAAISPSEFANAAEQYFPQPGDGAAVLAQKAENRRQAIANMKLSTRPGSMTTAPQQGRAGEVPAVTRNVTPGETPVALPPRGTEPQPGQLYQTAKGPAVYLGNGQFQMVGQ